jgi:hypothetical protein
LVEPVATRGEVVLVTAQGEEVLMTAAATSPYQFLALRKEEFVEVVPDGL